MNTATLSSDEIQALVANKLPIEQTVQQYRQYAFTPGIDGSPATFRHKLEVLAFISKESFKVIEQERHVRTPKATANALKIITEISEEVEELLFLIS